jgi:uncharacterized protein (DUF2236 family)
MRMSAASSRGKVSPHEDYGLFGPGSITWRVWMYPTSLTVGFQRSVVIEELDPFLVAAVAATDKVRSQPRTRYDRTLRYFATVAFGDSRSAVKGSEMLVKVHSRAVGIEPVSGRLFDANDPDSQLWIHLTAWHSILYAYERYGPGRLSEEEEQRYWDECAVAARLQTCDPAKVPRSREGIRAYFAKQRPRLAASEETQVMMDHLLHAEVMLPPLPRIAAPLRWISSRTMRAATLATMPRWQRKLAGLRQSRFIDAAIRPYMRLVFAIAARSTPLQLMLLGILSPATRPVVEPVMRGIPPQRQEALSPGVAFARHGTPTPGELYARLQSPPTAPRARLTAVPEPAR